MTLVMTADDLNGFLETAFLEVAGEFHVEEVAQERCILRLRVQDRHLRPGGTISGPAMFGLADVTAYITTLARIGPRALAVTTNCSIDFMRKPQAGVDLLGYGRLLKLGKQLSVTDVLIHSEGMEAPVARASLTYAIPPQGVEVG
ncbi:MAG: PaaI family thioesterase [Pseudomonadota bacterium]